MGRGAYVYLVERPEENLYAVTSFFYPNSGLIPRNLSIIDFSRNTRHTGTLGEVLGNVAKGDEKNVRGVAEELNVEGVERVRGSD